LAASSAEPDAVARVALIRTASGRTRIEAALRALGPSAGTRGWRAIASPHAHRGPHATSGCKHCARAPFDIALEGARAVGADEALLFDAAGFLVEGARSNLCYVSAAGVIATPPLARGAVAGLALAIARERAPEIAERDLARQDLGTLRELVALNAVRGAVAVTSVDGKPVGSGSAGELAQRIARSLAAAAEEERT
jgi:branched-chain amino acid aminotransferase